MILLTSLVAVILQKTLPAHSHTSIPGASLIRHFRLGGLVRGLSGESRRLVLRRRLSRMPTHARARVVLARAWPGGTLRPPACPPATGESRHQRAVGEPDRAPVDVILLTRIITWAPARAVTGVPDPGPLPDEPVEPTQPFNPIFPWTWPHHHLGEPDRVGAHTAASSPVCRRSGACPHHHPSLRLWPHHHPWLRTRERSGTSSPVPATASSSGRIITQVRTAASSPTCAALAGDGARRGRRRYERTPDPAHSAYGAAARVPGFPGSGSTSELIVPRAAALVNQFLASQ